MATVQPQNLIEQGPKDSEKNETQQRLSKGYSYISLDLDLVIKS